MTTNPADPSACKVGVSRHTSGEIAVITIFFPPGRAMGATEYWGEDEVSRLIALARQEEDSDPHSDRLPSDRAIICAALRDLGIPILGEQEEDTSHERDTFVPHPDEDADRAEEKAKHEWAMDQRDEWRMVPLRVVVNDSHPGETTLAGQFHDDNMWEEGTNERVIALARGEVNEVRLGGGAAPLVVLTRVGGTQDDIDAAAMERALFPAPLPSTVLAPPAPLSLLDAAKALLREWDSPDPMDTTPVVQAFDALRAAIAQAEGR